MQPDLAALAATLRSASDMRRACAPTCFVGVFGAFLERFFFMWGVGVAPRPDLSPAAVPLLASPPPLSLSPHTPLHPRPHPLTPPSPNPSPTHTCGVPMSPSTSERGVSADTLSTTTMSTEPLRTCSGDVVVGNGCCWDDCGVFPVVCVPLENNELGWRGMFG